MKNKTGGKLLGIVCNMKDCRNGIQDAGNTCKTHGCWNLYCEDHKKHIIHKYAKENDDENVLIRETEAESHIIETGDTLYTEMLISLAALKSKEEANNKFSLVKRLVENADNEKGKVYGDEGSSDNYSSASLDLEPTDDAFDSNEI